jgi:hypothetical protein
MRDDNSLILTFITITSISIAICFGFHLGETYMQKDAILNSHAEWVADTNGKPQFKWKECK